MIHVDSVSRHHGQQILFLDASFAVHRGEKVGLTGPNGAGKSSFFRMIMQEEEPDAGRVTVERNTTLGYFSQDVGEMSGGLTVEATMAGAGAVSGVASRLKKLEAALADPAQADDMDKIIEEFGEVQSRFEELGGYALESRAREILAGLGFAPDMIEKDVGDLSGGWKMRVALARILLMSPDALLLDEPTNHLDIESILWLEGFIKNFEGALIITSHDRDFLNRTVTRIVDIDGGEVTSYSGNYDFFEEQRAIRETQAEAQYERQQAMLAKEKAFIAKFK
ncbi:MAG: ABC-F family ATP-binding cassette domain-containing protein, partial [Myxococcales bacterium]|nr:ABC-F family ATP-binding cassette domain-containing protein [Myxococcales bacterium]